LSLQTLVDLEDSGKNTLNSSASLCPFSNEGVIYVGYIVNNSSLFYVWQICKSSFDRFQEHLREAKGLLTLASLSFEFKPPYANLAREGFHSSRVLPIKNIHGDSVDSVSHSDHKMFKLAASLVKRI
jgi:hypothetical protein